MVLGAGSQIGQNVRLKRLLGQGGMGSVWVGEHLTLHTDVAVKFMAVEIAQDGAAVARFSREATAAAQIKSSHVVQTFDHGVTPDGIPYIVMELLEGEDLGKRIERVGALPPALTAQIISQVCRALTRAHALGIVHRDIKPDNIFLTDSDGELTAKVLDFGIAKRTTDTGFAMTSTGAMIGTPYYMSPEQITSARDVDFRSDLWSLGVVAYHALTGMVPFNAETLGALCIAIDRAAFAPPSRNLRAIPPALDAWCARALARDPAQRFGSAREMADTLTQAVAGLGPINYAPGAGASGGYAALGEAHISQAQPHSAWAPSLGTSSSATSAAVRTLNETIPGAKKGAGLLVAVLVMGLLLAGGAVAALLLYGRSKSSAEPVASALAAPPPPTQAPAAQAPPVVDTASPPPVVSAVLPEATASAPHAPSPALAKPAKAALASKALPKSTPPVVKPAAAPVAKERDRGF